MSYQSPFSKIQSFIHQGMMMVLGFMILILYGLALTSSTPKILESQTEMVLLSSPALVNTPLPEFERKSLSTFQDMDQKTLEIARTAPVRFSPQLVHLKNIASRKETFVSNLLPVILASNEEIAADRRYLMLLKKTKDSGHQLSSKQRAWLQELARKYKVQRITITELLKRVDIIPPSLALAQAVVETGWGGSTAAQQMNSPFGMMKSRTKGFAYANLQESVSHYIHNLNTHEAYGKMRTIRSNLRNTGGKLCSLQLVEGLVHYSELGKVYISRVKNIIHSFKLHHYDHAQLAKTFQAS